VNCRRLETARAVGRCISARGVATRHTESRPLSRSREQSTITSGELWCTPVRRGGDCLRIDGSKPLRTADSVVLLRRAAAHQRGATAQGRESRCQQALADMGDQARYNQLRDQIMNTTEFQTHGSTGHQRSLPAGFHRAGERPIPPAVVTSAARGRPVIDCPHGSRPSGCPRPMRRAGSEKIGTNNPPALRLCGRVWLPLLSAGAQTSGPLPFRHR